MMSKINMPTLNENLQNRFNQNLTELQPSAIRAFSESIADIDGLVMLSVGEPGFNTPEHVKKAMMKSIADNHSHYSPHKGIKPLRDAISHFMSQKYNLHYDPDTEIMVNMGATEAIAASVFTTVNPGDEVLIPAPFYPLYESLVRFAGGKPIFINTAKSDFVLTPDELETVLTKHPNAKALILNYPNNPTGVEYTPEQLQALVPVLKQHAIFVIADEIYSELTYGIKHHSLAEYLPDQTVVINGVSKSHAMTGYRLGFTMGPAEFITQANKMHGYLVSSPSDPAQYGALEALSNGMDDAFPMRDEYQKNRDEAIARLKGMGLEPIAPTGAFYIFVKIPTKYGQDDVKFAQDLAQNAKVGVIPGSAFGEAGKGYIRISYAASKDDLETGLTRMEDYLN